MFIIASPVQQMPTMMPSSSSGIGSSFACGQAANAAGHSGSELFTLDALKELKKLSVSSVDSVSSVCSSGLRRTVSSLHPTTESCSHQNQKNACIVQAKQVEMDFASLTSQPFYVSIKAPNGEVCKRLSFPQYGQTASFSPKGEGCGHGEWAITIHAISDNKVVKKITETISLDGVGSLFFTVDDQLKLRLSSQEFLRLPSASQCCSNQKHA
jgi:hypothetical protein